jgi:predicted RND superfamily exporter protein
MLREDDRLPESEDIAAQYLLFMEMFLSSGRDLSDVVNVSKSATLVSVGVSHADSRRLQEFGRAAEQWLKDNAPELVTPATGLSMAYAYLTTRNMKAMLAGTLTSIVVVSILMLIVMRNWRVGLVSLIPNIVPAVFAFGAWGFLVGEVNLAISVVGAMTYGIVVDDTVHSLSKYLMARKSGLGREDAIRRTYELTGPAVIMMSVPLVAGFGVLAFSGFAVTAQTGMMSAMTIAIALFCDLFMVPPLLLSRRLVNA